MRGRGERARRKPTTNLNAYDYYLQGIAKDYQTTKCANDDALRPFYKAGELEVVIGDLCPLPQTLALLRRFFDGCLSRRIMAKAALR